MQETFFHRVGRIAALMTLAGIVMLLSITACRRTVPILDTSPLPAQADGTISGTVRGPEGSSPVDGRNVEVINIETGQRHRAVTNNAGGFTLKLAPGRYRVELALLDGETLVKRPGVIRLDRSDVDAHADFVIGSRRISRPRLPRPNASEHGLGSPVA